ncbi:MAG: Zn-ribbon domain-containing OB-fold protein [Chloroflexi bacterium]|nr:Zn-ribbon domain-containing OB-fold protein [Chloroflexota bacterium]
MNTEELIEVQERWNIPYRHSAGRFASRFLIALRDEKKVYGVRCPRCKRVLVPPRPFCERCFVQCTEWVGVSDKGTLEGFTISYQAYVGLPTPPYASGLIKLDGADTALMHFVGGVDLSDPQKAKKAVKIGMRVEAVWKEERLGHILDIEHFRPVQK